MKRTTALANAISVFTFVESISPEWTATFYKADRMMEICIHVGINESDAINLLDWLQPIVIEGAKVERYDTNFSEEILISVRYYVE